MQKQNGTYGYALIEERPLKVPVALSSAKRLHKTIRDNFGTLPFCRRYLERLGADKYLAGVSLHSLTQKARICILTQSR